MSGVNKFDGEGQAKIHHVVLYFQTISKEKVALFPKKKVSPSEKVTPSEDIEKGTNFLNDIEEPVVTIRRKGLDNFQRQSASSKGSFNLDHE